MSDHSKQKRCRVQRGFFILRECGAPAAEVCPRCERPVCSDHQRPYGGQVLCVECVAREEASRDTGRDDGPVLRTYYYPVYSSGGGSSGGASETVEGGGGSFGGGGAGGSWSDEGLYNYREAFYADGKPTPVAFDEGDAAAFNQADRAEAEPDRDGGFYDS